MTRDDFDAFCRSLPHTTHVVQWGGASVWKIGDKVFAIAGWQEEGDPFVTFKVTPMTFDVLKDEPGCRPAPYLASRGMSWIQCMDHRTLSEDDLKAYLTESYRLVGAGLSKTKQRALGLVDR